MEALYIVGGGEGGGGSFGLYEDMEDLNSNHTRSG